MPYSELDTVVLTEDLPDRGLRAGAEGVILHVHTFPRLAYEVEFFDEEGEPLPFFAVLPAQLRLVGEQKNNPRPEPQS